MKSRLTEFLYEIGHLKRVQRSGWWLAGIEQAESVAEHSFRTAVIAYFLAEMEGADPEKAAAMALFHDVAETRVNDLHRVGKAYIDWPTVGKRVVDDQLKELPPKLKDRLNRLHEETRAKTTLEARLVEDADRLECLLQAREYAARGYDVEEWIRSSFDSLRSEAAKEIAKKALEIAPTAWSEPTGSAGVPPAGKREGRATGSAGVPPAD